MGSSPLNDRSGPHAPWLAALALTACAGSVNDLSLEAAPFTSVKAHVDLDAIVPMANGAKLLAGIVWGVTPQLHPLCYEQKANPAIAAACPDPLGFYAGTVDTSIELDPGGDGTITIPIDHLPSANVLIGNDVSHVAYASIVVVADRNEDGQISMTPRVTLPSVPRGPGSGGGPGGGMGGGGRPGGGDTPAPQQKPADLVLAASFVSLRGDQLRLSFREGDFKGLELFYAAPSCGTPPAGYMWLRTGAYTDPAATCEATTLEQRVEVPALEVADAEAFACRSIRTNGVTQRPPDEEPKLPGFVPTCIGGDTLVFPITTPCPAMAVFKLSGCALDPKCEKPDWDLRETPPTWWPCAP